MATYKITNITNLAGKRDAKFNSSVDIVYIDKMRRKTISVKPNNSVYLTISTLPLSVHKLRVRGLITVVEIGENELNDAINSTNKKAAKVAVEIEHAKSEEKKAKRKPKNELE